MLGSQGGTILLVVSLIAHALGGTLLGLTSGWVTTWISKSTNRRLLMDAVLGAVGAPIGVFACALAPWPENTVIEQLGGGATVISTMGRYQHPERVAILIAILLPIFHEMYRTRMRERREPR